MTTQKRAAPKSAAKGRGLTLAQARKLPATTDVEVAALAFGISRAGAYESIRTGRFPVKTIRVGHRIRVLTADLIRVLEGHESGSSA